MILPSDDWEIPDSCDNLYLLISRFLHKSLKPKSFKTKKAGSHVVIRDLRLVMLILHRPYTQVSPSLLLIFSLFFLDNSLIDFQAFMDRRFLLFPCHCLFLCYCLSFGFPYIFNCCICFNHSFLQISPHNRHPCCSAIHFPLSGVFETLTP